MHGLGTTTAGRVPVTGLTPPPGACSDTPVGTPGYVRAQKRRAQIRRMRAYCAYGSPMRCRTHSDARVGPARRRGHTWGSALVAARGEGRGALCSGLGRGIQQVHWLGTAMGGCAHHPGRCSGRFVAEGTGHTLLLLLCWLLIAHIDGAEFVWNTHDSYKCANVPAAVTAVHAGTHVLQACKNSSVTYG